MKHFAEFDELTGRSKKISLIADNFTDELLLTQISKLMAKGMTGELVVNVKEDTRIIRWQVE